MSTPRWDWSGFSPRRGLLALLILAILIPLIAWLGKGGGTALIAALLTLAANSASTRAQRVTGFRFVLVASVVVAVGLTTQDRLWLAAALAVVVTFIASPALAVGGAPAARGVVLLLAMLLSHALAGSGLEPLPTAAAVLAGGLLALAVLIAADSWRRSRNGDSDEAEEPFVEVAQPRGPDLQFALINATTMAVAVVLGELLFPEYPVWVAITVAVTLQPRSGTLERAIQRTLGTAAGVVVALVLVSALTSTSSLTVAIAASAVLMVATMRVNYTLFVTLLTAFLLLIVQAAVGSSFDAGWSRLLATLIGAALSLGAVSVFALLQRDRQSVK